jgi:hypothetical protein
MRALADLHDVDIGMSSHKTPQGNAAVRGKGKGKGKGDSVGIEETSTQEDAEDDGEYVDEPMDVDKGTSVRFPCYFCFLILTLSRELLKRVVVVMSQSQ